MEYLPSIQQKLEVVHKNIANVSLTDKIQSLGRDIVVRVLGNPGLIVLTIVFIFSAIQFHYAAGKLSYMTNGSYPWAILSAILAPLYYPYWVLNKAELYIKPRKLYYIH